MTKGFLYLVAIMELFKSRNRFWPGSLSNTMDNSIMRGGLGFRSPC